MGSGGGYTKKTSVTGTQKKLAKKFKREFTEGRPYRQEARESFGRMGRGEDEISRQMVQQFGPEGLAYQQPLLSQQMIKDFEPIQQESRRQFQQNVLPDVLGSFGRGSRGSSALNQALAQAATNLQSNLNAQLTQFGIGERARQQEMQYNTLGNQYTGRQQAASQLLGAGLGEGQVALNKEQFAFAPRSRPVLQDLLLAGAEAGARQAGRAGSVPSKNQAPVMGNNQL